MNHSSGRNRFAEWRVFATSRTLGSAAKRAMLVAIVAWAATLLYGWPSGTVEVHLRMASTQDGKGEVFYRSSDDAFAQTHSVAFQVAGGDSARDYLIELPVGKRIDHLRIDPFSGSGRAAIHSLEVRDRLAIQGFTGQELFDSRGRVNQARAGTDQDGNMVLHSVGQDPYFEFPLQRPVGDPRPLASLLKSILAAISIAFIFTLIDAGLLHAWHALRRNRPAASSFAGKYRTTRLSQCLSDDLLEFTPSILVSFSLVLAAAVLYVGLKLHQSSIEIWEHAYPYAPVEQAIDIGAPRHIRSDEWKVQTPWVLNQALSGSTRNNLNLGEATAPLLASVPVADPIGYPNVKYAGFRFLDIERGYSWFWAYKSFGLALSFLWLLLILTRGHLHFSIIGTAWIYFSSYTQWWFSSGLPEIMTAFALGTIGALYLLYSNKRSMIVAGAALIAYAGANLVLTLYPPFIVSLGYLAIAIVVGYGLERNAIARTSGDFRFRLVTGITALIATVGYGLWLHGAASAAIEAMLNTTYPGQRISSSGDVPVSKLMGGLFEAFRIGETDFPRIPFSYNASEASGHLLLLPFLLLLVPLKRWFQRENALLLSVAVFCLLTFAWTCVQLPAPLDRTMQAGGWSLVTPKRAIMALGVGAITLCILLSARVRPSQPHAKTAKFHWIALPVIAMAVVYFGWRLRQLDTEFFSWQVIALGTLTTMLILAGMARGKAGTMAAGVAILVLPAITVNPLTSGLSSLMEKPVLVAAKRGGGAPGDRWMAIGDNFFAQGLKAVGLDAVAGTHYLPDRRFIDLLDPGHHHANVWNRYSTISMLSSPGIGSPRFELIHPDQYRIAIDVCSEVVREIGVTHVAYTVNVPEADLSCLRQIPSPDDSGVSLFRLSMQNAAP